VGCRQDYKYILFDKENAYEFNSKIMPISLGGLIACEGGHFTEFKSIQSIFLG